MRTLLLTVTLTLAAPAWAQAAPPPVQAQAVTQAAALERLFTAERLDPAWFDPEFLRAFPLSTFEPQLRGILNQFGAFVRLDEFQGRPLVVFERGSLIVTAAQLDAQGRLVTFGAVPGPAPTPAETGAADPEAELAALERIFLGEPTAELFAPTFLQQVPLEALVGQLLPQLRAGLGEFVAVERTPQGYVVRQERGGLLVTGFALDPQGRVTALILAPLPPEAAEFSDFRAAGEAFAALPGRVSVLVQRMGGEPLLAIDAGRPLAVGSSFKLAVLGQLQADVEAGRLAWNQELVLREEDKSLPSGTLQEAPAGSRFALAELALRMIRDSDNTATDMLMGVVDRAGLEARFGQAAMPSTRQAFALKNPQNAELLRAYRAGIADPQARRAVLQQANAAPFRSAELLRAFAEGRPLARDVEWFASTERLCRLIADVADLPAAQANPGVANPGDFARVAFKGGSEPGVLNLTTLVTTEAGERLCVSTTWNDARPLNDARFVGLHSGLLELLRTGGR